MNWQEAILVLKDHNVEQLIVNYEGSGDSGSIESIVYVVKGQYLPYHEAGLEQYFDEDLQNLTYPMLDDIEDWYNNDGGWGTLTIDLDSLEYNIENNIRYLQSDKYTHEGNLNELL